MKKSKFVRKSNIRKQNKKIYIFTEGKKTEPIYFKDKKANIESSIRRNYTINIQPIGKGTIGVLDYAIKYIKHHHINPKLDDCWIVFDYDDKKNFEQTIKSAKKKSIYTAYSNQAFELWFLLHFKNVDTEKNSEELEKELSNYLNYKYIKSKSIYSNIKYKESEAISRAKTLYNNTKEYKNPSTTVYLLVESLNKLK